MSTETKTPGRGPLNVVVVSLVGLAGASFLGWIVFQAAMGTNAPLTHLDPPALFQARGCANCHTLGGRSSRRGPGLDDFPAVAKSRAKERSGMSAAEYTVESILDPDAFLVPSYPKGMMPNRQYVPAEVRRLAAYILKRPEDDPKLSAAITKLMPNAKPQAAPEVIPGNPARGRKLFETNGGNSGCISCHSLDPSTPLLGPPLHDAGVLRVQYLVDSIATPSKVIARQYETQLVFDGDETRQGRVSILRAPKGKADGLLLLKNQFGERKFTFRRLLVVGKLLPDAPYLERIPGDGKRLDEAAIERIEEDETGGLLGVMPASVSLMPRYDGTYTKKQIDDLVAFLKTLNGKVATSRPTSRPSSQPAADDPKH